MVQETSQEIRGHFNSIARRYDLMNTLLSFGLHHLWKRLTVSAAGLQQGDHVLDVCGGTADLAIMASRRVGTRGTVVVYDFSMQMLAAGKAKTAGAGVPAAVQCVCGDAEHIAAVKNRFDAVFVGFGLRNLTDMQQGLKEMCRVIKPGGKLMCLEFSQPVWPPFRLLYDAYSFSIMPLLGSLIAGSREAYTYLPRSIRRFPSPEHLAAIMKAEGFSDITFQRLLNGIAVIYTAFKKG